MADSSIGSRAIDEGTPTSWMCLRCDETREQNGTENTQKLNLINGRRFASARRGGRVGEETSYFDVVKTQSRIMYINSRVFTCPSPDDKWIQNETETIDIAWKGSHQWIDRRKINELKWYNNKTKYWIVDSIHIADYVWLTLCCERAMCSDAPSGRKKNRNCLFLIAFAHSTMILYCNIL